MQESILSSLPPIGMEIPQKVVRLTAFEIGLPAKPQKIKVQFFEVKYIMFCIVQNAYEKRILNGYPPFLNLNMLRSAEKINTITPTITYTWALWRAGDT